MNAPIPTFDPLGLPLQPLYMQVLSYLTLTLHFVAMQFTFGSALLLLYTWHKDKKLARFFGTGIPLGFSYLVTFGIPPLLFVQVVYGQFFYTSSVLVGAFWIGVIPLVILAYGASYWHRMTRDSRPNRQLSLIFAIPLLMLFVGFIYVNNLTLSMRPERWLSHYVAHPAGGALNWGEPTLFARAAFFLVPALFVAGLALVLRAGYLRRNCPDAAYASQRLGTRSMIVATVLEACAAVALLFALPVPMRQAILGPSVMGALALGAVILALGALVVAFLSSNRPGMRLPVLAAHLFVGAEACVVVLRDFARQHYLSPYFKLAEAPVLPQWRMFGGFVLLLLVGLVFLVVVTKQTISGLIAADGHE